MSDMVSDMVYIRPMSDTDTRTTTRWSVGELEWLEVEALRLNVGVGTVVRAIVQAAMADAVARGAHGGGVRGGAPAAPKAGHAAVLLRSDVVGRVPVGAAPVPPSGAAPARVRARLDVVVGRLLSPGGGQVPPVALGRARRLISEGRVDVSGRSAAELSPGLLVGAGEVVLR